MKFLGRRFIALLLAVMMTLSLGASANAAEPTNYDDYIKVTDEVVERIVVEWAEYVSPGRSFDVSAIYDYYDQNDQLIGYSVSVTSNGIPYGYVLLDFFQENMISEFVIEENAVNICEIALTELQSNTRTNDLNNRNTDMSSVKLHKCLPLSPAVSVEVGGTELYAIPHEGTEGHESALWMATRDWLNSICCIYFRYLGSDIVAYIYLGRFSWCLGKYPHSN